MGWDGNLKRVSRRAAADEQLIGLFLFSAAAHLTD